MIDIKLSMMYKEEDCIIKN